MIRHVLHTPADARRGFHLANPAFNHLQLRENLWILRAYGGSSLVQLTYSKWQWRLIRLFYC